MTLETGESKTLLEAVSIYIDSFKTKDNQQNIHRELHRFLQWCGPDRRFSNINPSEIGDYADQIGGTGTTPLATERLQVVRNFLSYARKKGMVEVNLAQHVRIRKSKNRSRSGQVQQEVEMLEITAQGHAQLVEQLEKLRAEREPLSVQIRKAAADKDVRENAPLEAAREQLGHVESRIREIEDNLKKSVIVDSSASRKSKIIKIGAKVTVKDLSGGRQTAYTLVSRTEANPLEARISDVSPMGQALMGRTVGDEVVVDTPRGKMRYSIQKVS